ncbi:PIG-M-domain-containing protein [Peziza echinospora]|nr:PIG-M-domain-containing protein [Peziza echinospora]
MPEASSPPPADSRLWRPLPIFALSALLRAALLLYGLHQDATSPFKYTDIDYFVFTDAARFTHNGGSPYDRETYRYTPLLAWLLVPTAWGGTAWFSFGKVLFALGDLVAGWGIIRILVKRMGMRVDTAVKFTGLIWLLNPMVATISTRGSSEGLLGVMVVGLLWAAMEEKVALAGMLLGLCVHWKIYPVIYAPAIVWWMGRERAAAEKQKKEVKEKSVIENVIGFFTRDRIVFGSVALATFAALNAAMYLIYGFPFLQHTYLHHVSRVDHRHNFSPYNILLYLISSPTGHSAFPFASLPFLPQLLLSALLLPLAFAKTSLPTTLFAQTFAFVTFNKVCTSQYFMWYLMLLPFYLPTSSLLERPVMGAALGGLWVAAQALWLQQGYELEFLGRQTFWPGLGGAGLAFFVVNVAILGVVVGDLGRMGRGGRGGVLK